MGEIIQNFGFDVLFKGTNMLRLLQGLWAALRISLISVALSIGLGLAVGALMGIVLNAVLPGKDFSFSETAPTIKDADRFGGKKE